MKKYFIAIALLVLAAGINAQERSTFDPEDMDFEENYGHFNFWEFIGHYGGHLTAREEVEDILSNGYFGGELRVGVQSTGRQYWQRMHKYPQYGIGFALFDVGSKDVIGNPSGLFGFINLPIARWGRVTLGNDITLGISYDFNPYDATQNPQNSVIGSNVNVWAGYSLNAIVQVSERSDIKFGLGFIHYSNGRTRTPNMGLNMLGFTAGYRYNYNPMKRFTSQIDPDFQPPIRPSFTPVEKPPFTGHWEAALFVAGGWVTTEKPIGEVQGPKYPTMSIVFDVERQISHKVKIGTGLDYFYDGSIIEEYENKGLPSSSTNYTMAGWHIGPRFMIERFTVVGDVGFYIMKGTPEIRGNYYFRAGGRFDFTNHFYGQITLKTRNGFIADWIEWGLGYRLFNKDKIMRYGDNYKN